MADKNLRYVSQDSTGYTVETETGDTVSVAKVTQVNEEDRLHHAFKDRWLHLAAFGLPLGGVLTVIFSPFVFWENLQLLRRENLYMKERIHAKNLMILSVILFIFGIIFFSLFLMHLLY